MISSFLGGNFNLAELLYRLPAILISLSFHEWAHAYAAYKSGDPTARNLGRMTINPMAHIDPLGFVCLLLFRFGWAKPVPVNSRNYTNYKKGTLMVSLAGVTMNFLLAVASTLCIYLYVIIAVHGTGAFNYPIWEILNNFLYINLALMVFNLLPIPPLDGSHVAELFLIRKLGPKPFYFLSRYGNIILIVLMVTGVIGWIMNALTSGILSAMFWAFDGLLGGFLPWS